MQNKLSDCLTGSADSWEVVAKFYHCSNSGRVRNSKIGCDSDVGSDSGIRNEIFNKKNI
jgi:hypothetical protein